MEGIAVGDIFLTQATATVLFAADRSYGHLPVLLAGLIVVMAAILIWAFRCYNGMAQRNKILLDQKRQQATEIEKLAKANEKLKRKNQHLVAVSLQRKSACKRQENWLGFVAHDLRSPLNQVLGVVNILDQSSAQANTPLPQYLSILRNATNDALALADKILNQQNGRTKSLVETDIHLIVELVKDKVDRHQILAHQKGIALYWQAYVVPARFMINPHYLGQVVDNLVSNAIKYSPMGKKVLVSLSTRGNGLLLSVSDQGPGVAVEDLPALFKKYHTLSAKPTGGEPATGLGLCIVKRFVKYMRGRVWVESPPGKGATFFVSLPDKTGLS